ncbi:MAG: gas vesicle protein [Ignavibacteria bacterium RBG_13_36_8]|nr:MAG: gas vesicle protein [Ignavibacteria bacterium RBG_13_36_8]
MAHDNGLGKGLIVGFLTGSIVGSIVALLFAPKSGKELRGEIGERAGEFFEDAENYMEKAKVRASELINDGKKKSEKLIADAKVKVDGLLHEAEKILHDAKQKSGTYVETQKGKLEKEGQKLKSAVKAGIDTYKSEKEA